MHRRTKLIVALMFAIGVVGIPAAATFGGTLFGGAPVSGDIPLSASNGPTVIVTGASNLNTTNFTDGPNTVNVTADTGNATFSSTGYANVTADSLIGAWTNTSHLNVSKNALTIDPADKQAVTVSGDTDTLDFRSIVLDDGTADIVYSGSSGTTTLTVTGLSTTGKVAAVETGTNKVLDVATVSSGTVTFTLPNSQHTVSLQTSSGGPSLSDPHPTGDLSTPPSEFRVNVSDPDYPADNVTVDASLDGAYVGTNVSNTSGIVTFGVPSNLTAGKHNVTMTATDQYGQTDTLTYTFTTPDTIYIRNETSPNQLVNNSTNVTLTFYGQDDTVVTRTTSNGTINMTGLPPDETFVVEANAKGYHRRTIIIENLWQQQTIYLLSESMDTVLVDFALDDDTGRFIDDETSIRIQKAITINGSTEYRTISGDFISATGEVSVFLQRDQRYRLVAKSSTQTRRLGSYVATVAGDETITIGQIVLGGDSNQGYHFRASTTNTSSQDYIRAVYVDEEQATTSLSLDVYRVNKSNNSETLVAQRSVSQTLGKYTELIPISNKTNNYRIEWTIKRNGETITGEVQVGELDDITSNWPIADWVLEMLGMIMIVGIGGLMVIYDSSLAGIAMVGVATLFTALGIVPLPLWVLAPAAAAAILFQVGDGGGVRS